MAVALVVDDAADIRLLIRGLLGGHGFEVREVADGTEALAALADDPLPDVVVLDVQMPELDGWDTLAAIRGEPRTASLPVVLCTVRSQRADLSRGWRLGCDAFVVKPFSADDLVAAVAAACDGDEEQRAARRRSQLEAVIE